MAKLKWIIFGIWVKWFTIVVIGSIGLYFIIVNIIEFLKMLGTLGYEAIWLLLVLLGSAWVIYDKLDLIVFSSPKYRNHAYQILKEKYPWISNKAISTFLLKKRSDSSYEGLFVVRSLNPSKWSCDIEVASCDKNTIDKDYCNDVSIEEYQGDFYFRDSKARFNESGELINE